MKRILIAAALLAAGCSEVEMSPAGPTANQIAVMERDAKSTVPWTSCTRRDDEVQAHVAGGGARNTIIALSNGLKVYLQDVGYAPGYVAYDWPSQWCQRDGSWNAEGR